jgi:hypothetical protein
MLIDRDGKEGVKSIHPSTPAQELLNGITYTGWWRVSERQKKGGKLSFWREKIKNVLDPQSILFEHFESLNTGYPFS